MREEQRLQQLVDQRMADSRTVSDLGAARAQLAVLAESLRYYPDVIKQTEYVGEWRKKSTTAVNQAADIWSEVLAWELETSKPKLVVGMGRQVGRLLTHRGMVRRVKLPIVRYVEHCSHVGVRPCEKLPAMAPSLVEATGRGSGTAR